MRLKNPYTFIDEQAKITEFSEWILRIRNGTFHGIKDPENEDVT